MKNEIFMISVKYSLTSTMSIDKLGKLWTTKTINILDIWLAGCPFEDADNWETQIKI